MYDGHAFQVKDLAPSMLPAVHVMMNAPESFSHVKKHNPTLHCRLAMVWAQPTRDARPGRRVFRDFGSLLSCLAFA